MTAAAKMLRHTASLARLRLGGRNGRKGIPKWHVESTVREGDASRHQYGCRDVGRRESSGHRRKEKHMNARLRNVERGRFLVR